MIQGHQARRGRRGFTLVELLVVMAIITILASISIPVVVNYIRQGQATRALADINGIETALTEVLADAGRSKLEQLFESGCYGPDCPIDNNTNQQSQPFGVANYLVNVRGMANWPPQTAEEFRVATELYTRALTGILRSGRNILGSSDSTGFNYSDILQDDVVRKLGLSYIDLGPDPWGNLYNIYPGPWTARYPGNLQGIGNQRIPVPFRIFYKTDQEQSMPGANSLQADTLSTQYTDPDSGDVLDISYPAPANEIAFIWSNGQNLISSQAVYSATGYPGTAFADRVFDPAYYDQSQPDSGVGGGDDINNWDPANSWTRFY